MVTAAAGYPSGIVPNLQAVSPAVSHRLNWSLKEFLANLAKVKESIGETIARHPDLCHCRDLLAMKLDGTGLRIELRKREESGGSEDASHLTPTRQAMEIIARELGRLPTRFIDVQIHYSHEGIQRGHRKAAPASASGYAVRHSPYRLTTLINEYAWRHGVDPELVKAVVRHESGFNPRAISPKGAEGLMQLMPATAVSMGVKDPFDPEQNLAGGITYLRLCLDRFQHNVPLAVAAYNAGPERVARYGGIPPFLETRFFVQRVMHSYGKHSRVDPEPAHDALPGGSKVCNDYPGATLRRQMRQTSLDLNAITVIEVRLRKNL